MHAHAPRMHPCRASTHMGNACAHAPPQTHPMLLCRAFFLHGSCMREAQGGLPVGAAAPCRPSCTSLDPGTGAVWIHGLPWLHPGLCWDTEKEDAHAAPHPSSPRQTCHAQRGGIPLSGMQYQRVSLKTPSRNQPQVLQPWPLMQHCVPSQTSSTSSSSHQKRPAPSKACPCTSTTTPAALRPCPCSVRSTHTPAPATRAARTPLPQPLPFHPNQPLCAPAADNVFLRGQCVLHQQHRVPLSKQLFHLRTRPCTKHGV